MRHMELIPVRDKSRDWKLFLHAVTHGVLIPIPQDMGEEDAIKGIASIPVHPADKLVHAFDPSWSKVEKIAITNVVYSLLQIGFLPTGPRPFTSECVYCGRPAPNVYTPVCSLCVR